MSFLDYSDQIDYPIFLQECNNPASNELFRNTINKYHSYVKYKDAPTRNIRWLVIETSTGHCIGAVGIASCVLALKSRDGFVGWDKDARMKNSNKVANNSRFCLIPNASKLKNVASMTLKLVGIEGRKRWKEKYGDDLVLLETYIEQIDNGELHRSGACYKASNWIYVGETTGVSISKSPMTLWKKEDTARGRLCRANPEAALEKYGKYLGETQNAGYKVSKSTPKMVFVKPLVKDWRKHLVN